MQLIRYRKQCGDTIVEVLIAIAVISSVLGTAYAIVNRNARSYQQIHEHSEALKLAEGQLEQIRAIAAGTDATAQAAVFSGPDMTFCIVGGAVMPNPCSVGVDSRYQVIVERNGNRFESIVTWAGVHGGQDRVSLSYRMIQ